MERNQRSPGDGSDERLRAAGAHSRLSPGPPVYGSGSLWSGSQFRRAKSSSVPILLSAHWGLLPLKFESIAALPHTAWCLPTCWVRRWSGGPAATVLPEQAVSAQRRHFEISDQIGPCGPGQGGCKILCSGRREDSTYLTGGRSSVMGVQGGDAYEHRRKPGVRRRSPLGASQGELPQRGKRGWPGPLVTFCAYTK